MLRLGEVCGEVVVVLALGGHAPSLPDGVRARVARDAAEAMGPLGGALAGLLEVRTEFALLAGGDMPHMQPAVLRDMVRAASQGPADAVALADDEGMRPLPAVLRPGPAIDVALGLLEGGRGRLRDLLVELRVVVIDAASWRALDPDGGTLDDVDAPSDLRP
jgi:molybdopterin-guanine dinucleotide biosynthesis protein A